MGGGGGGGCTGHDVIKALNKAFMHTDSAAYTAALTALTTPGAPSFATVQTGADLAAVYALLVMDKIPTSGSCKGWADYLGNVLPSNALIIANARKNALRAGLPMLTTIYPRDPALNYKDVVHVYPGSSASDPAIIATPYDYNVESMAPSPKPPRKGSAKKSPAGD